ncbi:MAG: amidohydrolase, partial [Bacteroidia bacterium]|nr:amidohydrolase [Bacteroidia bacterium]
MKKIIVLNYFLFAFYLAFGQQPVPASTQTKSILLMNGIAHLGNGKVIENSAIGFKNGKITLVADATVIKINGSEFDTIINIPGKHVYPGFIAVNSTLGLLEVEAVRATNDIDEVGAFIPNVRTQIAYNTDSKITPTVRTNGILIAQVVPRKGIIAGTSSVFNLDGWNWEDALLKGDEGIHLYFPKIPVPRTANDTSMGTRKQRYEKQLME